MGVTVHESRSQRASTLIGLSVEQSGMDITVKAGDFRWKHAVYTLAQDEVCEVEADAQHVKSVIGYLTRDTITKAIDILVDEVLHDGVDTAYDPKRGDEVPWEIIHNLFIARVPAGATSLDDATIKVYHIIDASEEDVGGEGGGA